MITNKKQTVATVRIRTYYMDPEFLETGHLSPKLDVYSIGIIVLQLLTGKISYNKGDSACSRAQSSREYVGPFRW